MCFTKSFRLSTSAHNTPKSTRKSEKKIEIKPTVVNSSATRTGVQDVKPINPQKSTRISNVIKTGLNEVITIEVLFGSLLRHKFSLTPTH